MNSQGNLDIWSGAGLVDFITFDPSGGILQASTTFLTDIRAGDNIFEKLPVLHGCEDLFDETGSANYPTAFEGVTLQSQSSDIAYDFRIGRQPDKPIGMLVATPNISFSGTNAKRLQDRRKVRFLENLLAKERARFEYIYKHSPVCAFALNEGQISGFSDELAQWAGPKDAVEQWVFDFIDCHRDQLQTDDRPDTGPKRFRTAVSNAANHVAIVDVTVLQDQPDTPQTYVVLHDVTLAVALLNTVQRQRDALEIAKAQLQTSNRRLEQFAHVAAHDLLGPLGRMSSFSEIVELEVGDKAEGMLATAVDAIKVSARESIDLVRDLLTLAKLQHFEPIWEEIDLHAMIAELIDRSNFLETVELRYSGRQHIIADRRLLQLIARNAVSNSYKYRHRQTPLIIHVELEDEVNGLSTLKFIDNGMGFDDGDQDPFSAFTRMREHAGIEGTGLGLAMVKDGADTLGWTAGIASVAGQGTTLIFSQIRQNHD